MRFFFLGLAALALAACADEEPTAVAGADCARSATHEVAFSDANAPDIVTARSEGPTCKQAIVVLTIRNAAGDPLWATASTYYTMTIGGGAPADAPEVTPEEMDRFLAGWADLTVQRSTALPEWRADAATLTESVQGFAYETPFDRETYQMLRARNLQQICYASAVEASQCLIIDPLSNEPMPIVSFGP